MSSLLYTQTISKELSISQKQVEATLKLLEEGATVPFISRYRKEATGSLDEVQIVNIRDLAEKIKELEKRREFILKTIDEQEKLSPQLKQKIEKASTLTELEDIYLPYKPKRRTKATIAREKGLEPLAKKLFEQNKFDVSDEAFKFINKEKEVASEEEALQGARDIMAEWINEDATARESLRTLFNKTATIKSKVLSSKKEEGEKYKDYFEWEEPLSKAPSHRILAIRRGEKEMILSVDIAPEKEQAMEKLESIFIKGRTTASEHVQLALEDSYKRILKPSLETEMRLKYKLKADTDAINVFADNIKELLLASPLGDKNTLALDPGFRTGCKLVCLDKQGKLLENTTIYPNEPQNKKQEASAIILALCEKYKIEAIAIGNGTAGRETETFIKTIKELPSSIITVIVNESGASIYSASDVAREEFPDHDLTVRGSVSIGRRLQDPLAELVKLDPKSIGVGQYQHDVDQNALKSKLDEVVESCVNAVGVEVNSASKQLLTYVSGLGPTLAQNIVDYRNENGAFKSRKELMKVPRMGAKVFEQAAGFLRIRNAKNPLDASAVHPESYHVVEQITKDLEVTTDDLIKDATMRSKINIQKYVSDTIGLPTLKDIISELDKPGRDPRKSFEVFSFAEGVNEIADLHEGMELMGIVTNVTNFGAFVDIGVHQDGLVHISQLSDTFVSDPKQVVKVAQQVKVRVTEVDVNRKRIALSMKSLTAVPKKSNPKKTQDKPEPQGDLQSKLAMLKGKFGK